VVAVAGAVRSPFGGGGRRRSLGEPEQHVNSGCAWLPSASVIEQLRQMRVGVLLGGTSPERPGSLISGTHAAAALRRQAFDVLLIDPAVHDLVTMLSAVDIVLMALHGPGGEDGHMQGLLDAFAVPYSGSGVLASAVGMHKPTFKHVLRSRGVDTPAWVELDLTRPDGELRNRVGVLDCRPW
jgi:D-alanine--D-alanine ligase